MSAILVYVSRKAFIRIKICRYSVIKANIVCYRGKMIVENITNLTGIIDNNFPFLKNYLIGVENLELSEIRGLLYYQKDFWDHSHIFLENMLISTVFPIPIVKFLCLL